VELHPAGRRELRDLVLDGRADTRDLRPITGPVGADHVERRAADCVGGTVVGDRLEHELALDLEDVADLVEDPGQRAVGQLRLGAVLGPRLDLVIASGLAVVESRRQFGSGEIHRRYVIGAGDTAGHQRRW
jgi:hypothetical protein